MDGRFESDSFALDPSGSKGSDTQKILPEIAGTSVPSQISGSK